MWYVTGVRYDNTLLPLFVDQRATCCTIVSMGKVVGSSWVLSRTNAQRAMGFASCVDIDSHSLWISYIAVGTKGEKGPNKRLMTNRYLSDPVKFLRDFF